MRLNVTSWVYISISGIVAVSLLMSLRMEYLSSKLLPLIIGGVVFVLSVIGLIREMASEKKNNFAGQMKRDEGNDAGSLSEWIGYAVHGSWIAGFFLVIYLLGFMAAVPLFLLLYMKWLGNRWPVVIAFAVVIPFVLYAIFEIGVGIDLYPGILFLYFD